MRQRRLTILDDNTKRIRSRVSLSEQLQHALVHFRLFFDFRNRVYLVFFLLLRSLDVLRMFDLLDDEEEAQRDSERADDSTGDEH